MIHGLVYVSDALVSFTEADINHFSREFSKRNKQHNITGYMSFASNRFTQYIEGEDETLSNLFSLIHTDPRHKIIFTIASAPRQERIFPSWNMRYVNQKEISSFELETSIEDNLIYIKNDFIHKKQCQIMLWEQIETLALLRPDRSHNI